MRCFLWKRSKKKKIFTVKNQVRIVCFFFIFCNFPSIGTKKRRLDFDVDKEREPDLQPEGRKISLMRLFSNISSGTVEVCERPKKQDALAKLVDSCSENVFSDDEDMEEDFVDNTPKGRLYSESIEMEEFYLSRMHVRKLKRKARSTPPTKVRVTQRKELMHGDFDLVEDEEEIKMGADIICHVIPQSSKNVRGQGPSLADIGLPIVYSSAKAPPLSPVKKVSLFSEDVQHQEEPKEPVVKETRVSVDSAKDELDKIFF